MITLYLCYALAAGGAVLLHARRNGRAREWGVAVFMAPVLSCGYIATGRHPAKKRIWLCGWTVMTLVFLSGEAYLHSQVKPLVLGKPTILGQTRRLGERVQKLSYDLDRTVLTIDRMSLTFSKASRIVSLIEVLDSAETQLGEFSDTLENFLRFLETHEQALTRLHLAALFEMKSRYRRQAALYHRTHLAEYLTAYRNLLVYARDHHDALRDGRRPATHTYDTLFFRYRLSVKRLNRAWTDYHNFLATSFRKNPELEQVFPDGKALSTLPEWWAKGKVLTPYRK